MILWRLSTKQHANAFDGGYGLLYDGRWNTAGHAVTYCATSPALCILEKLVHIEDQTLMPALVMVQYYAPDDLAIQAIDLEELDAEWRMNEGLTQARGDRWHEKMQAPLLRVPSAIVPIAGSPDVNYVINHRHPDAARIKIVDMNAFELDARLF